jgi:Flp pilus assembly pilin Flp
MTKTISILMSIIRECLKGESGQDSIECSLLVGIVVVVGIAVLSGAGTDAKGIWATGNSRLAAAKVAVY